MKKNNKINTFRKLIYEKKKKSQNMKSLNKKNHIKRNILYNKKNIISNIPSNPIFSHSNLFDLRSNKDGNYKIVKDSSIKLNSYQSEGLIYKEKIYIIFRVKNHLFQHNLFHSKDEIKKKGIRIQILEKTFKEFEKEILKIAKKYSLDTIFINNPFKVTTKKGILIRMGKGKGKIIERYKMVETNKVILLMTSSKEMKFENLYLLTQVLSNLNKKFSFLSKCLIFKV